MPEIRVLVVSANAFARAGLASLLTGLPNMIVAGTAGVSEAGFLAGQLLPDVALVDAAEGELEDLDAIARFSSAQPSIPIVALAADQGGLAQALAFGASAILPSGSSPETIGAALVAATQGLVVMPRADLESLLPVEEPVEAAVTAPKESLTPRELEVLQLMARGLTNRQIARRLQISEHTVKFHAAAILGKVNARSRAEAVARAIGLGWILV
jgi:two-component system, NarL family, response regulator YdfI